MDPFRVILFYFIDKLNFSNTSPNIQTGYDRFFEGSRFHCLSIDYRGSLVVVRRSSLCLWPEDVIPSFNTKMAMKLFFGHTPTFKWGKSKQIETPREMGDDQFSVPTIVPFHGRTAYIAIALEAAVKDRLLGRGPGGHDALPVLTERVLTRPARNKNASRGWHAGK